MKHLSVSFQRVGQEMQASLKGALVTLAALKLNTELHSEINVDLDPWDRLIIDLTKVTDVDTTGINTLFQTQMSCVHRNRELVLRCQNNHPVKSLLKLTHADQQFDIELG